MSEEIKRQIQVKINEELKHLIDEKTMHFAQMTLYDMMVPFIPMDTGALLTGIEQPPGAKFTEQQAIKEAQNNGSITAEGVTFSAPYAAKMYFGDDFNFSRERHPLATSRWDTHVDIVELARKINNELKRKARERK